MLRIKRGLCPTVEKCPRRVPLSSGKIVSLAWTIEKKVTIERASRLPIITLHSRLFAPPVFFTLSGRAAVVIGAQTRLVPPVVSPRQRGGNSHTSCAENFLCPVQPPPRQRRNSFRIGGPGAGKTKEDQVVRGTNFPLAISPKSWRNFSGKSVMEENAN